MNPVADQISWLDRIPFVGHFKSLMYYIRGKIELAAEAFRCATHNTCAAIFGVVGGICTKRLGPVGSILGGIFGGVSADATVSIMGSNRYGYFARFGDRSVEKKTDWNGLLQLAIIDGVIGQTSFALGQLTMYWLNSTTVIDQLGRAGVQLANPEVQAQVGEVYPTQSICRDERQSLLHKSYNLIKNTCECVGSIYAAGKRKSHQITRIIDTVQNLLATICIIGILSVLYLLLFYMLSKI